MTRSAPPPSSPRGGGRRQGWHHARRAEKEAQIAILSLKLNDALAKNDGATALKAAETLRSFGKEDGITCPADASPQAIAELMRVREMTALQGALAGPRAYARRDVLCGQRRRREERQGYG